MASLDPHTGQLGKRLARHLLRRASFRFTKEMINDYANLTPAEALDDNWLFKDNPITMNYPWDPKGHPSDGDVHPDIGYWIYPEPYGGIHNPLFYNQTARLNYVKGWWWLNAFSDSSIKYKLAYFLHTRFTAERITQAGNRDLHYLRLLLIHAYGSYKELAFDMTHEPTMAEYLDNRLNTKTKPNENYAREFLELFTIGKGEQIEANNYTTYTEHDVVQAARVLSGFSKWNAWNAGSTVYDPVKDFYFCWNNPAHHDTGDKTFSNAFDNHVIQGGSNEEEMNDELRAFIDMIFDKKDTARHLARKMYQYFVMSTITTEIEEDIIEPLADILIDNDYDLKPAVRALLSSKHFYDLDDANSNDNIIGGMAKSPLQLSTEICSYFHVEAFDSSVDPNDPLLQTPLSVDKESDLYKAFLNYFNLFYGRLINPYLQVTNQDLFEPGVVVGHAAYHQAPKFDRNWISSSTMVSRYKFGESMLIGYNLVVPNHTNPMHSNNKISTNIEVAETIRDYNLVSNPANSALLVKELLDDLFGEEPETYRVDFFKNEFLLEGITDFEWTVAWGQFIDSGDSSFVEPRLKNLVTNILRAPESQTF